jgi:hypothetical protein
MQLIVIVKCLCGLFGFGLLVPTHAQTSNTATASINPTATNVALATQAIAQIANNNTSGLISEALNGIPGFLQRVNQAVTGAVAQTRDQLKKILAPELYYSYGRSPPVYPTRKCTVPPQNPNITLTPSQQRPLTMGDGRRQSQKPAQPSRC